MISINFFGLVMHSIGPKEAALAVGPDAFWGFEIPSGCTPPFLLVLAYFEHISVFD